jgi:hypothetical protein
MKYSLLGARLKIPLTSLHDSSRDAPPVIHSLDHLGAIILDGISFSIIGFKKSASMYNVLPCIERLYASVKAMEVVPEPPLER